MKKKTKQKNMIISKGLKWTEWVLETQSSVAAVMAAEAIELPNLHYIALAKNINILLNFDWILFITLHYSVAAYF